MCLGHQNEHQRAKKSCETLAWNCEIQSQDLIYIFIREVEVKNLQVQATNISRIQGG